MYSNFSTTYRIAQEQQRDTMAEAHRERRARQARPAPAPQAPSSRYGRRGWQLFRVHTTRAAW
jgi:hypothetical protein